MIKNLEIENIQNNQQIIRNPKTREVAFYSYGTLILYRKDNVLQLTSYWDYSNTTSKYLYEVLRGMGFYEYDNKKAILKAIENKDIKIINYNK